MGVRFEIRPPATKAELLAEHRRLVGECEAFWSSIAPERFIAPFGASWSPADTVRHLAKSVRPVASALRLPRPILGLLFGLALRKGESFAALVDRYHARLAAGGGAGRFAPRPVERPDDPGAFRATVVGRWRQAEDSLCAAVERWNEKALDRYRMPHPLLGKLTVREMLFFTLYHGVHHARITERRMAEASSA
ncbi:MAG: DinB family protein [Thermoanaerobaculia bacterium]